MEKDDDYNQEGSYRRWQSITIGQLTYAINVILGFSIAIFGFQISLLLGEKFNPISWQKCAFLLSLFLIAMSIDFGIWVIINRLRDFRATKEAAKLQERGASAVEIKPYRDLYKKLGKRTWCLFWWQVYTLCAGLFFSALSVFASVSDKLFC